MYWKLFENLFEAHAKRKAISECLNSKNAMIAGVWGNSNYDPQEEGKQAARTELLAQVEEGYLRAVQEIRSGIKSVKEEEIDWTDPFFSAIKAPRIGTEDSIAAGMAEEAAARQNQTADLLKNFGKEIDQT